MCERINKVDLFACPDDGHALTVLSDNKYTCEQCGRLYHCDDRIWNFLPSEEGQHFDDEQLQRSYYDETAAASIDTKRKRLLSLHMRKAAGILEAAAPLTGGGRSLKICEVGVGTALHAAWLMDRIAVECYIGIDISLRSLTNGRERWEGFPAFIPVLGSAYRLPLHDGFVDLVFFAGSLHHCEQPEAAIAEAARSLCKGGILVISEPVWYFPANLYYNLRLKEEHGQRLLRRNAVELWCRDSGLRIEKFSYFNFLPHPRPISPITEKIELAMSRIPLVGKFSSMFRCIAHK